MNADDPFDLDRFVSAQRIVYDIALNEIRNGRKQSHWMWFIFPQLAGLGLSSRSAKFAIKSLAEANAYLAHPVLGPRLVEIAHAALNFEGLSAREIFGAPDDQKLQSCATLFAHVSAAGSVFQALLDKYFDGHADERTVQLLNAR
ncbi:MAG: DUF1810 domain-containing protein [Gemmatimonadaceae bacterium]